MKRLAVVLSLAVWFLAGCGGGSAGPSQNNPSGQILTSQIAKVADSECVVKPIRKPNTYRSAVLDMRFDQPDFNNQGMLVNSYNAVTLYIDKINCVGFDTVVFQTNTPIDTATGALMLYDPDVLSSNRDKSIPKDFWPLVDYAKNKGLTVLIKLIPVNYITDDTICPVCKKLPATFNVDTFFNAMASYEKQIAQQAQLHKVDGFYIGAYQTGLDATEYTTQWDKIISQVQSVYSGKLIYESCYQCSTFLWSKVDIVALGMHDIVLGTSSNSLTQLINHQIVTEFVSYVQKNSAQYAKPIIIDSVTINASATKDDLFAMTQSGQTISHIKVNYPQQAMALSVAFELTGTKLNNIVTGVSFREYMPWGDALWIQRPNLTRQGDVNFNLVMALGIDLYHNEPAQTKLSEYLQKPWGHHTMN
jgi:hypothetical protein